MGVLFIILRNYFKTLKPNYFIGIRTPWTLKNDKVWKATHILTGKIWLIGGLLVVFIGLILNEELNLILFLIITVLIIFIPVVYSYLEFMKEKKHT